MTWRKADVFSLPAELFYLIIEDRGVWCPVGPA